MNGGIPIDLLLFGMVAAFLVLRLKGILGKRTGYERPPRPVQPPVPAPAAPVARDATQQPRIVAGPPKSIPEPGSALGQTLAQIASIDRNFTPAGFLDGAAKAFEIIVTAFANGDRQALRPLLGDEMWKAFDLAITEREKAGHTHVTEVTAMRGISIERAELNGSVATITVSIGSDQRNLDRDQAGQIVNGADAITEINDIWTFERDLRQPGPAWRLEGARSA
jgi:predicted lipid-binding transport protein (Tim44 family)